MSALESSSSQSDGGTSPATVYLSPSPAEYGALCSNLDDRDTHKKFYLTTAISYTNGYPHVGHAYEFMTADIITRYYRVLGYDTFFLTGSDEHGQKVAASAEKAGRSPKEHCDIFVDAFKAIDRKLCISYSRYVRTTDGDHELTAQRLWDICAANGDIYLDSYEGWYNEREETFVTELEAEENQFKDPVSGNPLKRVKEESYFFKMSRYTDKLIAYIQDNPECIQPEQYRNNIVARLTKEGLKDLSVSRTSFSWGIPVPAGFDSKHVMYVWFDALSNYLTGCHGLDQDHPLSSFWPASLHIIGKDIIWFHCVIWPCILMSAGIPLPATVYSHGFVNAEDGTKMSKSLGNVVDPNRVLDVFSADSVRYYCCASVTYGADLNFSEKGLITMHNSELADILGNLVHRVLNLCSKYCGGIIPDTLHDAAFELPFDLEALITDVQSDLKTTSINLAVFRAMEAARATNRYLTAAEPWKMKGVDEQRRPAIVRTTLEAVYAFMHFLAPVIPLAAQVVFDKLNTGPKSVFNLRRDFYNLQPGTPVSVGDILFKKIEVAAPSDSAAATSATPTSAKMASGTVTGIPKASTGKASSEPAVDTSQVELTKLDLRVGRISKIWCHESADKLYCEQIDVGNELRNVASGLRPFYDIDQLDGRLVVVVCNLKEAKIKGFVSQGMVLAAKSADGTKCELVTPPEGAVPGDRITVPVHEGEIGGEPFLPKRIEKFKIWDRVVPHLKSDSNCVACWQERPLVAADKGVCTVASVKESQIA